MAQNESYEEALKAFAVKRINNTYGSDRGYQRQKLGRPITAEDISIVFVDASASGGCHTCDYGRVSVGVSVRFVSPIEGLNYPYRGKGSRTGEPYSFEGLYWEYDNVDSILHEVLSQD